MMMMMMRMMMMMMRMMMRMMMMMIRIIKMMKKMLMYNHHGYIKDILTALRGIVVSIGSRETHNLL